MPHNKGKRKGKTTNTIKASLPEEEMQPKTNKVAALLPYIPKVFLYVAIFICTTLFGEKGMSMLSGIPHKLVFALVHFAFIVYICWGVWVLTGWISKYRLFSSIKKRMVIILFVIVIMVILPPVYTVINVFISDLGTIEMEEFGNDSTDVIVHYGERPEENEVALTKTTIGKLKDESQSPININGENVLLVHINGNKVYVDSVLFGGYKKRSFINLFLARTQDFIITHHLYLNTDISGFIVKEELSGYIADNDTVKTIADTLLFPPVQFKDNWIEKPENWRKYERATAVEIRNEYNIPVLVLEYKNPYEITVSGIFISSFGIMKVDNDDNITFHFSSNLNDIGKYTVNNIFVHWLSDYFRSEKTYNLCKDYSEKSIFGTITYTFQRLFKLPTREVKNLVIRTTVFPATDTTPNGLLIEFAQNWEEIDPINITVNVTGTRLDGQYAWWAEPNLQGFDLNEIVSFRKGVQAEAFEASSRIDPPVYEYYSLGKPISASNSLYSWFVSPESMNIETITFQGERFIGGGDKLIWERI